MTVGSDHSITNKTGEMIATICIFEDGNIQQATMKTKAEQDQYTDEWSINGKSLTICKCCQLHR